MSNFLFINLKFVHFCDFLLLEIYDNLRQKENGHMREKKRERETGKVRRS